MSPKLFFVLGLPKSGTTWLQLILNAHPNICCHSEGGFYRLHKNLGKLLRSYNEMLSARRRAIGQGMPPVNESEALKIFRSIILIRMQSSLSQGKELMWLGEKDPDHALNIHLTMRMFPNSTYIHIIRDGRDQCVSFWHHLRRTAQGFLDKHNLGELDRFIAEYAPKWAAVIRDVRKVRADIPQARYFEVRYEAMVSDPDKSVTDLLSFLGANTDEAVVASCVDAGNFEKLSGGRKPGDEDPSSFFRKGVVGDWRNHFDDAMTRSFSEMTGGLLEELGYE